MQCGAVAADSAYADLLSILYLRCTGRRAAMPKMCAAFNSLFEMQIPVYREVNGVVKKMLSILYLRCSRAATP